MRLLSNGTVSACMDIRGEGAHRIYDRTRRERLHYHLF